MSQQPNTSDIASESQDLTGIGGLRPFGLTESLVEDGCREIQIEGELDLAVADRLQEALAGCQEDRILISLDTCQFIDSTGIAVILTANRADGARIVLHSPSDQVLRVLEVTGLTSDDLVVPDREQAISALVRPG